ncbi:MAG: hypothetical protein M1355_03230 [Patescibacteria group bacterium]|nr:hypothetical protein [Patescibacteria group bacterium]
MADNQEEYKERRKTVPRGVTYIYILDWITFALLILGLFGVLVPLLIVPPYPISGGRIGGGAAGVSVTGFFALLTLIAIYAVYSRKRWGKIYHTIFSLVLLLAFPIGTILQGLVLYFLYADPKVGEYFK